jgi:HEAT repeat protein
VRTCINPECFKEFPVDHNICDYCGWPQDIDPSSEAGIKLKVQRAISDLSNPDPEIQGKACEALKEIGPAAAEAVPALIELIKCRPNYHWRSREYFFDHPVVIDHYLHTEAFDALRAIGPAAVPALVELIRHSQDRGVLAAACKVLEEIGPAASEAVPALVDLIRRSQDAVVLEAACGALEAMGPAAAEAVPALVEFIRRNPGSDEVECWALEAACEALRAIGPAASEAASALVELIRRNPSSDVLEAAYKALKAIGPAAAEAVPALVELIICNPDLSVFWAACEALEAIGPAALPKLRSLIDWPFLLDKDKQARIREVIERIEKKHGKR